MAIRTRILLRGQSDAALQEKGATVAEESAAESEKGWHSCRKETYRIDAVERRTGVDAQTRLLSLVVGGLLTDRVGLSSQR